MTSESRRILLTGGTGMLGRAILRKAADRAGISVAAPTRGDYDLSSRDAVRSMFADVRPHTVLHAAARVGGIEANISEPYEFLAENVAVNMIVIDEAYRAGVEDLLFIGSSCMYPKDCNRPLFESDILSAPLEPTNEGYAISKIVGAKACEYLSLKKGVRYRTIVPCNLYGPFDSFAPGRSHLLAAIISKTVAAIKSGANEIEIWGDGEARREFLYVDDLAAFLCDVITNLGFIPHVMNVGAMQDHTINEYYAVAAKVLGWRGQFVHDRSRPVGMRRKLMDSSLANTFGWRPDTELEEGVRLTTDFYLGAR